MLKDAYVNYSQNYRQNELNLISNLKKLTCIQDIAMFPVHSSVVSMIPNQNTARTRNIIFQSVSFSKLCFHYDIWFLFVTAVVTWTCLQSWPLAGSCIRRKVIGHLRDTLMAVCSTPSSPLSVALPDDAATLLKFLLTVMQKKRSKESANEARNLTLRSCENVTVVFCMYLWWCNALQAEASSSVSPGGQSEPRACGPAAARTNVTAGGNNTV